ncbi:LysE family translocator [Stutzerimonas urumqiensis]|uniref:LysE family translocator n=1 Tax=Stutzerimonas urumqiensis TaxID=638269 RepID=UPI003DA42CF9
MPSADFLLTALIVVLIPGTGVLYTLSVGLLLGQRASLAAALGCTAGIVPALGASLLGLALVLHMSALAFQVVKFAGVAYLLYLAWSMWRSQGTLTGPQAEHGGLWRVATRGFLINILNPKLSIFFLAFLPQFIEPAGGSAVGQMLMLGAVFMAMTLVVFLLYGLLAGSLRQRVVESPRIMGWLQRSFAVVFAALGARLALAER